MNDAFPFAVKVLVLREVIFVLDQSNHHLSDCRGAGKTWGLDTCRIKESRCVGNFLHNKLVMLFVCTKTCERCDDLVHRKTILCQITVGSLIYQIINDLLRGIYTFFVLDIRSGRTYEHVAVNGRSGKNTFAHRTRQREDRCVEVVTQLFIHQQILAFTGNDLHLLFTYHVMHNVRINSGCIDHDLCFQRTFVGIQLVIAIFLYDILYLCLELEFHAVHCSVLTHGDSQVERTDDTAGRNIESCHSIRGKIRLHLKEFISLHDPCVRNTVLVSLI